MLKKPSQAVRRSVESMRTLLSLKPQIKFSIITDEPHQTKYLDLGIHVIGVPESFQPRFAKHKARALEYFRHAVKMDRDDWILHLDEETTIDEHALNACVDFIREEVQHDFAQVCC